MMNMGSLKRKQENVIVDLGEKEEKLGQNKKASQVVAGDASPLDVLELNVGGTCITVLRRTLCQVEDSMLASRFSGRWDDSLEKDRNGRFFIDQSIKYFGPFVDYLRALSNETPEVPLICPTFKEEYEQREFIRMIDYYGCADVIYQQNCNVKLSDNVKDTVTVKKISKDTFSLLCSDTNANRRIAAFEVDIDTYNEKSIIGWVHSDFVTEATLSDIVFPSGNLWFKYNGGGGGYPIGADCVKMQFLCYGQIYSYHYPSISTMRPRVRCQRDMTKWFVNEKDVDTSNFIPQASCIAEDAVPTITCDGHVTIVKVELEDVNVKD